MAITFLTVNGFKRIDKERMYMPVTAFQFWEQNDFKALLNETMDKMAFYKFNPGEEKMEGIAFYYLKCSKSEEILTCLICIQRLQQNSSIKME